MEGDEAYVDESVLQDGSGDVVVVYCPSVSFAIVLFIFLEIPGASFLVIVYVGSVVASVEVLKHLGEDVWVFVGEVDTLLTSSGEGQVAVLCEP